MTMTQRSMEDRSAAAVSLAAEARAKQETPAIQEVPANQDVPADHAVRVLEEQLATIIASARAIAVAAEELLRDVSQSGTGDDGRAGRSVPHAIAVAPRLLAATEQQLLSVKAMLRKL